MAKAAYNRLLSLSDIQLGPQKLNFAVTKIVTVLIFGIFAHRVPRGQQFDFPGLLTYSEIGAPWPQEPSMPHTVEANPAAKSSARSMASAPSSPRLAESR